MAENILACNLFIGCVIDMGDCLFQVTSRPIKGMRHVRFSYTTHDRKMRSILGSGVFTCPFNRVFIMV